MRASRVIGGNAFEEWHEDSEHVGRHQDQESWTSTTGCEKKKETMRGRGGIWLASTFALLQHSDYRV